LPREQRVMSRRGSAARAQASVFVLYMRAQATRWFFTHSLRLRRYHSATGRLLRHIATRVCHTCYVESIRDNIRGGWCGASRWYAAGRRVRCRSAVFRARAVRDGSAQDGNPSRQSRREAARYAAMPPARRIQRCRLCQALFDERAVLVPRSRQSARTNKQRAG